MLDLLSTNDAIFPTLDKTALDKTTPAHEALTEQRGRPGRDPLFSVETLMEGRGAYASVFEDATTFLRR